MHTFMARLLVLVLLVSGVLVIGQQSALAEEISGEPASTHPQSCPDWFFVFRSGYYVTECATEVVTSAAAIQEFEGGRMLWYQAAQRYGQNTIYVIYNNGTWQSYRDTWDTSQPLSNSDLQPPEGLQAPVRGFGKLWETQSTVRNQLGWAYTPEQGFTGHRQSTGAGDLYIDNGNWVVLRLHGSSGGSWVVAGDITGAVTPSGTTVLNTSRPPSVTNQHIAIVDEIGGQVRRGEISQADAERRLNELIPEVGASGLAWLTRRMPIQDENGSWTTVGRWADGMVQDSGIDPNSPFGQDPIGTAADLMFGNYDSTDDLMDMLGFDLE